MECPGQFFFSMSVPDPVSINPDPTLYRNYVKSLKFLIFFWAIAFPLRFWLKGKHDKKNVKKVRIGKEEEGQNN